MFRIRDPQESLWQSQFLVTPKKAKRLERSWAEVFRNEALPLIDEERFAPMYCVDNGRPNRAVQTVLGVHLLVERMVASVTLLVVRTHSAGFGMGHYLWYFLTSSQGQAQLQRQLTVSPSVTSLSASNLSEVKLSVPSAQKLNQIARLVEASENAYAATLKAARIGRAAIRDLIIGEVQSDPLDLYT